MKNKILKILSLLFSITILAGCLGFGNNTGNNGSSFTDPNFKKYETSLFAIVYPNDWEILEPSSFTSNIPKETVVAFRNNIKNEIFTANTNITVKQLAGENVTSEDFGKSSLMKAKETLIGFKELSNEPITIKYGSTENKTFISGFEGKKTAADQIIHFKQLYIVNGKIAFTITASYLPYEDEAVVKKMDQMLHSFMPK